MKPELDPLQVVCNNTCTAISVRAIGKTPENFDTLNKLHSNNKKPLSKQLRYALLKRTQRRINKIIRINTIQSNPMWLVIFKSLKFCNLGS